MLFTDIYKSIILLNAKSLLKENGFRTKGNVFWRDNIETLDVIGFQKSQFNVEHFTFYINIGIDWKGHIKRKLGDIPDAGICTVHDRLEHLCKGKLPVIGSRWIIEKGTNIESFNKLVLDAFVQVGLPFIEQCHNIDYVQNNFHKLKTAGGSREDFEKYASKLKRS